MLESSHITNWCKFARYFTAISFSIWISICSYTFTSPFVNLILQMIQFHVLVSVTSYIYIYIYIQSPNPRIVWDMNYMMVSVQRAEHKHDLIIWCIWRLCLKIFITLSLISYMICFHVLLFQFSVLTTVALTYLWVDLYISIF